MVLDWAHTRKGTCIEPVTDEWALGPLKTRLLNAAYERSKAASKVTA